MKLAIIGMILALAGCTNPDKSRLALQKAGYSDIQIKGWGAGQCGDDDSYTTEFTAKNPVGVEVSGVVCCGVFKGCTIRF